MQYQTNTNYKFVKDQIHEDINFYEDEIWFIDLIKTPEFRRLSRVKQLGPAFLLYPGATHTRYAHSLGCYETMRKIINKINPNCEKKLKINILIAALLHDIGHGPHSHAFEIYTGIKHEGMTIKIICDEQSEINKVLKANNLSDVDINEICSIIATKHELKWVNQILSSQVDADRLDYLARDAHFTGAKYGNIDIDLIIKWMYIKDDEIIFNLKGLGSIENFLIARYHMYTYVYNAKVIQMINHLYTFAMKKIKDLYTNGYKFVDKHNLLRLIKPWLMNENYDIKTFAELNDEKFNLLIESMCHEEDFSLKEVANSINDFNSRNYIVTQSSKDVEYVMANENINNINNFIIAVGIDKIYDEKNPIMIFDKHKKTIQELTELSLLIKKGNKYPKRVVDIKKK